MVQKNNANKIKDQNMTKFIDCKEKEEINVKNLMEKNLSIEIYV